MLTISSRHDLFRLSAILLVMYHITIMLKVPFILFDFIVCILLTFIILFR
jgi:hypothetical protein